MARRKGERTTRMNEWDFPHIVELAVPSGGFGSGVYAFEAFHRERGIESRRARGRRRNDQEFVRFCFADHADADAFAAEFGGTRVGPQGARSPRQHL
jgi:hypothetical protein